MSEQKPVRVESASVSEIELINSQPNLRPLSKTEQVVKQLNKFRFKNQNIMHNLLDCIAIREFEKQDENSNQQSPTKGEEQLGQLNKIVNQFSEIDREKKTIKLTEIDRSIEYRSDEWLYKLQNYLNNMDVFNQILPDFTYSQEYNDKFFQIYGKKEQEKKQDENSQEKKEQESQEQQQQQQDNQETEKKGDMEQQQQQQQNKQEQKNGEEVQEQQEDLENQVQNNKQNQQIQNPVSVFDYLAEEKIDDFRQNFYVHAYYGYSLKNVQLDKFESYIILIMIEEFIILNSLHSSEQLNPKSFNLTLDIDSSNPPEQIGLLNNMYNAICVNCTQSAENPELYDIYILLLYSDAFEGFQTPQKTGMRKTIDGRSVFFSTQKDNQTQQQYFSNGHKNREFLSVLPQKYGKLIKSTTQIPEKSVEILVKEMDSDGDLKIIKDDIKNFAYKHYLHWEDQVFINMFKEAASKRRVTNPKQYEKPITIPEILGAVTLHQRLSPEDKRWVEFERPFRKYWVQLLEVVGEKVPYSHDLPPLQLEPIKDYHQISNNTFKPNLIKSKSMISIKPLKKPQYIKPFRAEAQLIINNTQNIAEMNLDKEVYDPNKVDAFEKVINQQFKQFDDKGNPTITFNTQSYYKEAERLAKNPVEYVKVEKNPIYSFFPENFNFKKGQQNLQPQTMQSNIGQSQRLISVRGSKLTNQGTQQDQNLFDNESSQFMEDVEDQMDIDSLLRTQSILRVGKQLSKTTDKLPSYFGQSQAVQSVIPVMQRVKLREQQMMARSNIYKQNKINNTLQDQGVFTTTFKIEDCPTLKVKLARKEPVTDPYNPVSNFNFREEVYVPDKRSRWQNRIKPEPLDNPFGISIHDPRPIEALQRQQKEELRRQKMEELRMLESMGKSVDKKDWVKYFVLPDIQHQMVNNKRPDMFPKGNYEEPANIAHNLLRGESKFSQPFKLFHRTLRTSDRNMQLGDVQDSKF